MNVQESDLCCRTELKQKIKNAYHSYLTLENRVFSSLGLTAAQCEILLLLYQRPTEKMDTKELIAALRISNAALSASLKNLKEKKYIRYISKEDDMRTKQISLTVHAMNMEQIVSGKMRELEDISFSCLTDSECMAAGVTLDKIYQNISNFH